MTPEQFDKVCKALRARGRTYMAARSVLVDGIRPVDAAKPWRVTVQAVYKTMRRIKAATSPSIQCPYCGKGMRKPPLKQYE